MQIDAEEQLRQPAVGARYDRAPKCVGFVRPPAEHHVVIRQHRHHVAEDLRRELVVGGNQEQVVLRGGAVQVLERGRDAAVGLVPQGADAARIGLRQALGDLRRAVAAAVVEDHDLVIVDAGPDDLDGPAHGRLERRRLVVRGNEQGERRLHGGGESCRIRSDRSVWHT